MAGFGSWFSFATQISENFASLPALYELGITCEFFVKNDVTHLYKKILTDVIRRTWGLGPDEMRSMWDNCLKSNANKGLVSLLAESMFMKSDLFLVYQMGVIRKATPEERTQIEADYKKQAQSSVGIYISFTDYTLTDMLRTYSHMEYSVLGSLNKKMNVSNAIQFKMSEMRGSTGATDKEQIKAQAKSMCDALAEGKNILMDGADEVATATVEMETTKESILFLDGKRSFMTGMPLSYINGQLTTGIGSTGQADAKAIDRGLEYYFISIIQPVCKALFNKEVQYKVEDTSNLASALEAIKTFELLQGTDILSVDEQKAIVRKLFNLENVA